MSDQLRKAAEALLSGSVQAGRYALVDWADVESLRAALSAPTPEPSTPDADAIVDEYADEYEYDESGHIPTEDERMLLADFGHGLVSLLHERGLLTPRLLSAPPPGSVTEPTREITADRVQEWMYEAMSRRYGTIAQHMYVADKAHAAGRAAAGKDAKRAAAALDALVHERDALRAEIQARFAVEQRDVWYWQGDGSDNPESLANGCHVVMTGAQLRSIIAAAEKEPAK